MTKKLNVLVVDDSSVIREVILDELTALGYRAYAAGSAEEAGKILSKSGIDIMFLDLKLPGIEGLDYLERIQQQKKDIVVIVMTAYESSKTAVEAIEKGAYDYVIKPIQPAHVELIIKRALKRYQIEQERQIAVDRRISALKDFAGTAKDTDLYVKELKSEVNSLLIELGRKPKYK